MIVHFVDIGGIDDHHCLNFLFIIVDLVMGRAVYQLFKSIFQPYYNYQTYQEGSGLGVMVFNATFNNISVISWWSVLLVDET